MTSIRLIAISDEYDITPGLALKGCNHSQEDFMADRTGSLIAHDIVEHQNGAKEIGSVWDELQALGGVWHCRGRHADFNNHYRSPTSHISADIARMYETWITEAASPKVTRPHDYDEDFFEAITLARKDIAAENNNRGDDTPEERERVEAYLIEALAHMRIGYRKAERRFGPHQFASNNLYHAIENALAPIAKNIEYAGQEFILTYTHDRVTVREVFTDA